MTVHYLTSHLATGSSHRSHCLSAALCTYIYLPAVANPDVSKNTVTFWELCCISLLRLNGTIDQTLLSMQKCECLKADVLK